MCSINGFNFQDEGLIRKMVDITRHRGPDQEGFYCGENISLGHARLSIIDLSEKARQPIWNEDKSICLICNGEIYNFQEIREGLQKKGHKFFSQSDSEVIIHLYEEKEEKCLEDLNGIFGFAIFDKNKDKIFLARDRIGVKPLYYYFDGKKFIFSSEIKAILVHPIKRAVDKEALLHYFRIFFVPSPFTLFQDIKKLPPANYLIYEKGKITHHRYWELQDSSEISSKEEAIEEIKSLLKDSVKRQLISDRPVGIFLSGGIDSSSILGMASQFISGKIKTYSVGFDINIEEEKFNRDFRLARQTSKYYKTDHHELLVSDIDVRDNIEKVIWHMEEPVPNPIQVPNFLLSQLAKKEVAVVLGGDGGDEIFGGYPRYYYSKLIDQYQLLPSFLRKNIFPPFLKLMFSKKDLASKLNTPSGVSRYLLFMGEKSRILSQVLKKDFLEELTGDFLRKLYPEDKFKDKTKYLMYLDLLTWLPDESLIRSDKMTMAFGLEERVPILDHRLVEFAFRIPTKYKVRGKKDNKWIFREAMKEYLPSHLLGKEKRGWFSPAAKWLRKGLKDFAYEVLSPNYNHQTQEYFNFPEIKKILDDHISGKRYNLDMIWSLLTFQIWYKTFITK
ncbi:MAG: asparagine synthase (glutamine-hydrolyzing) [Parcubacteria group bacterium]|nr:asparagine synthase (glutamine-hydrolyzing) [Parcubacteria group bacterium]|tara:strand:+ start:59947 stop:61794 length:1848 start_codon:yes stop_codon:yes gene_type:complete